MKPSIEPKLFPDGVVFRVFLDGATEPFLERNVLEPEEAMIFGPHDREKAMKAAKALIELYAWDGDSGELLAYQKMVHYLGEWTPLDIWVDSPTVRN